MNTKEQLFTVDHYKFRIFDSVPQADHDRAFVLFREGGDLKNRLVITAQKPALGSEIRAGGYNKIMEISLSWKPIEIRKEIADDTNNFRFSVSVKFQYRVKDPVYIFEKRTGSMDGKLQKTVSDTIQAAHKKYDIESQIELERDLHSKILEQLYNLEYLETDEVHVTAEPDERAKNIIDSNLDTLAQSIVGKNKGEQLSQEIAEGKNIEIKKLEAETEIQKKRNVLNMEKANGLKMMEEKLGEDYSTILAYINGEITNVEFDNRMHQNRNNAMIAKIQYFKQLVDMDVLSGPALERAAMKLLGEDVKEDVLEQQALVDGSAEDNDIVIEDTEEYL